MLVDRLDALERPTVNHIEQIISDAVIVWITKDENRELDRLKLRHARSDVEKAYRDAGIVVHSESDAP
jgi:hypothetical protein